MSRDQRGTTGKDGRDPRGVKGTPGGWLTEGRGRTRWRWSHEAGAGQGIGMSGGHVPARVVPGSADGERRGEGQSVESTQPVHFCTLVSPFDSVPRMWVVPTGAPRTTPVVSTQTSRSDVGDPGPRHPSDPLRPVPTWVRDTGES